MTAQIHYFTDTRLMMLRRRRRVFIRQLIGGVALAITAAFSIGYFGG
jgi:hypothetical protein